MFFAHGGLVKESAGLAIAFKHLEFWKKNDVYPIYFVWETGLFETLGQLLRRSQEGTRGFVSDHITDPLIERTARALQGPTIWGGMKFSAERAVAADGGARYVAEKLKAFCDKNQAEEYRAARGRPQRRVDLSRPFPIDRACSWRALV